MKELKILYNSILNDHSIQHYTLGYKPIIDLIEKRYKIIKRTDVEFNDMIVLNALSISKGKLKNLIECFAKELNINKHTLNDKERKRNN
jgi:hypothetical protein